MRIQLSESEHAELRQLQRSVVGTSDYVKVTCILMFANGRTPKSISEDLGIALSSLYRYVGLFKEDGLDSLLNDSYKGYWGRLNSFQISILRKELKEYVYTTAKSVANWIRQTFGITYTSQGVVDLLIVKSK